MNGDERGIGGALGTGIILAPQIFGWAVFRPGYGLATRAVVLTYMVLSSIPLYFLVVTLWGSGDDIARMAKDYDRNRTAAESSFKDAHGYIEQYEKGELDGQRDGTPVSPEPSTRTTPAQGMKVDARELARIAEAGPVALRAYADRPVAIAGTATAAPSGTTVYLEGTDAFPAVTLHYSAAPPSVVAGSRVEATCDGGAVMAAAGPSLAACR